MIKDTTKVLGTLTKKEYNILSAIENYTSPEEINVCGIGIRERNEILKKLEEKGLIKKVGMFERYQRNF